MKTLTIDPKSLVIGVLLGVCVLLLVAAEAPRPADAAPHYQIATGNDRTFVVDTRTGETWQLFPKEASISGQPWTYSWSSAGKPGR